MDIKLLHVKAVIANGRTSMEPSNDTLYRILELDYIRNSMCQTREKRRI